MRRARSFTSVLASAALAFVACGGNDEREGQPGPSEIQDEGTLVEALTSAWCDDLGPCCKKYGVAFDLATCRSSLRIAVKRRLEEIPEQYEVGALDPVMAERCVATVRRMVTACDASAVNRADVTDSNLALPGTCGRVYAPSAQIGEPCAADRECVPVDGRFPLCTGVCRDVTHVADGEGCNPSPTSDGNTSIVVLCGDSSSCEQVADSAAFVCRPKSLLNEPGFPDGADCQVDDDCHSRRCYERRCFTDKIGFAPEQCNSPLL
jgi:hypothetical protein